MGVRQYGSIIHFIVGINFIFVRLKPMSFSQAALYYFYRASIKPGSGRRGPGEGGGGAFKGKRTDIDFFPKDHNSPKISAAIII